MERRVPLKCDHPPRPQTFELGAVISWDLAPENGWFRILTRPFPFGMAGIFRPVIVVSGGVLHEPGQQSVHFWIGLKAGWPFSESPGLAHVCSVPFDPGHQRSALAASGGCRLGGSVT